MTNRAPSLSPLRRIRRASVLAGAVLSTSLGLIAPHAAQADTPCVHTAALSSLSSTSQSPCWRPFVAPSPFNTPLPANPQLASNNAAIKQHMAQWGWSLQGYAGYSGFSLASKDGDRPVYFATPSDPVMTIHCTNEEGPNTCQGANHVNVDGAQINVPAGAKPTPNWDAHMIIVETATGAEYDLWHTKVSGSTITSGTGSEENANTSDGTHDGGDAASFALTAGLLRPSELASGHINHALVLTVPCTSATGRNVGYVYPAAGGWGQYCGQFWNESTNGAPGVGQLFKLNLTADQIAATGAPVWERTIMTALSQYGAYIEDTNGSWRDERMHIMTQDPTSFTSLGLQNQWTSVINQLGGHNNLLSTTVPIPTNALEVVNPCVPQGTCPSPAVARTASTRRALVRSHHARRHNTRRHPRAYGGQQLDQLSAINTGI